ncbi:hypothetical protein FGO68_gene431 [Halteria grandinella]|uniref:Protein kinase domain-containing protein n=1 Tax=Halteria grandinella TaxID=5974 RepID=A0A8J8NQM6_HALGN|nr:hypothetical protein FGO68_gene431 [Halteria grandinella]
MTANQPLLDLPKTPHTIEDLLSTNKRYVPMKLIGEGSYGQVWLARDTLQERDVAIKVFTCAFGQTQGATLKIGQAVATELSIMRQLQPARHPNIVQVYDYIESKQSKDNPEGSAKTSRDLVAIVMEYLPLTLEDLMTSKAHLLKASPQLILDLIKELTTALCFLHSCGVIHRDIKPSNILLTLTDNKLTSLKLIDFSISKTLQEPSVDILNDLFTRGVLDLDSNRLTRNVTTRPYRAPEVALLTPYSYQVDMWAVGCILAELLMGSLSGQRELLFQAHLCQPLSPIPRHISEANSEWTTKEEYLMKYPDLLVLHAKFYGRFDGESVGFLGNVMQREYMGKLCCLPIKYCYSRKRRLPTLSDFEGCFSPDQVSLLKSLLQFNPDLRLSARQCLDTHFPPSSPTTEIAPIQVDGSYIRTAKTSKEVSAFISMEGKAIQKLYDDHSTTSTRDTSLDLVGTTESKCDIPRPLGVQGKKKLKRVKNLRTLADVVKLR